MKVKRGPPVLVKNSMKAKNGWFTAEHTANVDVKAMRDLLWFWENYEYRAVFGPFNDKTREVAVREYIAARDVFGGDFIEVGRHFSVGVNYVASGARMKGECSYNPDEVRYDIVLELFMHAPTKQTVNKQKRLLMKGRIKDTRNGPYTKVYVGAIRQMDMDFERGLGRIVAGPDSDLFDVTFSLGPEKYEEYGDKTTKRWLGEEKDDKDDEDDKDN